MASITVEAWTWYGFVAFMLGLRYIARYMHFKSLLKFQIEDYLMLFVFCLYTVLIEMLVICATVSTNLIDPADIPNLTPQEKRAREFGSKCVLVAESCMCAVQWGTKACLLILYWRLTENLRQAFVVKLAAVYVFLTYAVMVSLYYGYWCRPFNFWAVPTKDIQCATQIHHLILNLTFNLTSDILIMSIPIPLFLKSHLELKKKVLLVLPFSLGVFTMICAILSKHLSFTQPFSVEWVFWYTREASTAMIVTNMPYSWAIIRRVFHVKKFLTRHNSVDPLRSNPEGHISGVSLNNMSQARKSGARADQDQKISRFGSYKPHRSGSQKLASSAGSGSDVISNPASNGSVVAVVTSELTAIKTHESENDLKSNALAYNPPVPLDERRNVIAITARGASDIDRLYRLDDDDELDDIHLQPSLGRCYEPKGG